MLSSAVIVQIMGGHLIIKLQDFYRVDDSGCRLVKIFDGCFETTCHAL